MKFPSYKPAQLEPEILKYWKDNQITEKLRKKNQSGKKFYFLEGPPYTSGNIHLGHAWNMALKDIVLRYKRMRGYNVWDRMGYDMHGLPTEQKVMAKLNLKNKESIQKYGLKKFQQECRSFCTETMKKMNEDFIRLGATLDFSDPYQPISKKFMEAEWWLIKQAHEKGRLYQGLRTMHWDAATQTVVAKHELEYKQITDISIYLKFRHADNPSKYFIIWTTTPWTIPLNLALMVNPELDYSEVKVGKEMWILAKDLVKPVMEKAKIKDYLIKETYKGSKLEGQSYNHPLNIKNLLPKDLQLNSRLFTVLLTKEYVDNSSGTGIVHCAPGCGPEDYEVGHFYHIPPFNCVNEEGYFENFGKFSGFKAKQDDKKFIEELESAEALIAKEPYVHDYPHGERSHQPVIFRTTKQWFFKVEDLKEKMLKANEKIYWNPKSAKNSFTSWLENLRDNSITKQRFWGTPVPIWQSKEGDYIIISSIKELEKLSKRKVDEMHIPDIDEVAFVKNGKKYQRIPDILDVWIDAGTGSWNCLDYPSKKADFEKFFPADFILEGKDQIRGWFNLLLVASTLAFEKPSFKNVYMHGFVTDIHGVKMSKSLGNIISPYELIDKYGADVLRYYTSQISAGEDINFSWEECNVKARYLNILWNTHIFILALAEENNFNPFKLNSEKMNKLLSLEEKYILSKLHSTIEKATFLLEEYRLDEIIAPLEELFIELSRGYIQMIRDKCSVGSREDKEVVAYTISTVLMDIIKMFSLISPFICEAVYLNLKEKFGLKPASISHCTWPEINNKLINLELEEKMEIGKQIIQSVLAAREKAQLGVRWPVLEAVIIPKDDSVKKAAEMLTETICRQVNAKNLVIKNNLKNKKDLLPAEFKAGEVYLNLKRTPELEAEGYSRELMRFIQSLRKKAGLEKKDRITLFILTKESMRKLLDKFSAEIQEKVGANKIVISSKDMKKDYQHQGDLAVKNEKFLIKFSLV